MKTLYLDCGMGAAGDMLTAALLELFPLKKEDGSGKSEPSVTREEMVEKLNSLGIPDVEYRLEPSVKCGITGSHMRVLVHGVEEEAGEYDHHHHHDDDHHHHHDHDDDHHHHHDDDRHHHHDDDHHHHHDDDHHHDHDDDHRHHHDDDHHHHHDHDDDHHHHHHDHDDDHHHHHSHRSLREIREVVEKLATEDSVKEDILSVYTAIAEAEGHVHGKPVEEIHFHEVGTWDAVADVAAVSLLLHALSPDEIVVSPVHVGSGQVRCAHGILPVPAPATAYLLRDIPIYGGEIRGELCTPTGAALLRHFATRFAPMPVLRPIAYGYGMGKKDFPAANCVRAILGEAEGEGDTILMLSCNIDDMTGEEIGFAVEELFRGGARDVYTTPVNMKKSRPGILLSMICSKEDKEKLLKLLFKHTTTIGVREQVINRYTLSRRTVSADTPYGPVAQKVSMGYDVTRKKWEYEDIARIARETGKTLDEVREFLRQSSANVAE